MNQDEIKAVFDQQAASYDRQWSNTAPIRDGLHFLLPAVFADLPTDARIPLRRRGNRRGDGD